MEGNRLLGGFVGSSPEGKIKDCFAIGKIKGNTVVGGFIAEYINTVETSYAAVNIVATRNAGGFVANPDKKEVKDCYYYADLAQWEDFSGSKSIGFDDYITEDTFENWDFENTWILLEK